MSIELWPIDGVHLAAVDEDIIVLDVEADQYSCLFQATAWLTLREDGVLVVSDDQSANELQAAGLATFRRPAGIRRRPIPARRDHPATAYGSPISRVRTALGLLAATWAFRNRSFRDLIHPARQRADRPVAPDERALTAILVSYRSALPWIPLEGECLQRSFQLRRLLDRHGLATDWVFGVKTWPFGAHCWLQIGDEVVGDRLARVSQYTAIMVV